MRSEGSPQKQCSLCYLVTVASVLLSVSQIPPDGDNHCMPLREDTHMKLLHVLSNVDVVCFPKYPTLGVWSSLMCDVGRGA